MVVSLLCLQSQWAVAEGSVAVTVCEMLAVTESPVKVTVSEMLVVAETVVLV